MQQKFRFTYVAFQRSLMNFVHTSFLIVNILCIKFYAILCIRKRDVPIQKIAQKAKPKRDQESDFSQKLIDTSLCQLNIKFHEVLEVYLLQNFCRKNTER